MSEKNAPNLACALHRLALRTPSPNELFNFYRDVWQLTAREPDHGYLTLRTAGTDHDDLALIAGPRGIAHIAFAVTSSEELEERIGILKQDQVDFVWLTSKHLFRGDKAGVEICDPDGRRIRFIVPHADFSSSSQLEPTDAMPTKLGHVVLWTPNQSRTEEFYDRLGFHVTDRTHVGMSFLKGNDDHHTLAFMGSSSGKTGLQHVAFDVGTIDNVMRNAGRLKALNLECVWGVGRHGPGNNVFSYYTDPDGNFIEYYGDMEKVPYQGRVEPRIWGPEHRGDVWGLAGAPPIAFRE